MLETAPQQLTIFTDGGSRGNPGPAACGVVIQIAGQTLTSFGKFLGVRTNNDAEYEAFVASVAWLKEYLEKHSVGGVEWRLDSKLVVEQLNRHWKIKEPRIQVFAKHIWHELASLSCPYKITHIPREQNSDADLVVNQTLDAQ